MGGAMAAGPLWPIPTILRCSLQQDGFHRLSLLDFSRLRGSSSVLVIHFEGKKYRSRGNMFGRTTALSGDVAGVGAEPRWDQGRCSAVPKWSHRDKPRTG